MHIFFSDRSKESISKLDEATRELEMRAARGECPWVCSDCGILFKDGMPDECDIGRRECTEIIRRDKSSAKDAAVEEAGRTYETMTGRTLAIAVREYFDALDSDGKPTGGFVPKRGTNAWNVRVIEARQKLKKELDTALQSSPATPTEMSVMVTALEMYRASKYRSFEFAPHPLGEGEVFVVTRMWRDKAMAISAVLNRIGTLLGVTVGEDLGVVTQKVEALLGQNEQDI